MTPVELRLRLRKWLQARFRIDCWSLNAPENVRDSDRPPSAGLDKKISNYQFLEQVDSTLIARAIVPFEIQYRFDKSYRFTQIPREEAESLLLQSMAYLRNEPQCLHPDMRKLDPAGNVTLVEENSGDWILQIDLDLECEFDYHPEDRLVKSELLGGTLYG